MNYNVLVAEVLSENRQVLEAVNPDEVEAFIQEIKPVRAIARRTHPPSRRRQSAEVLDVIRADTAILFILGAGSTFVVMLGEHRSFHPGHLFL
jgi:hypothetical protein